MLDLDLDHRLGAELRAVVDDEVPSDRLDDLVRRRVRRRERQRRATVAAGAALALALVVGLVAVLRDDREPASVVASDAQAAAGDTLFLAPNEVPEGLELVHAWGGDRPGTGEVVRLETWGRNQIWGRFDAAGQLTEVVDIMWGDGRPSGDASATEVAVRGRQGKYYPAPGGPASLKGMLVWPESERTTVRMTGHSVTGPGVASPLGADVLVSFAETLLALDGGGFAIEEPLPGFQKLGEWSSEASEGTNPRALVYRGDDGRGFQLHVVDGSELPPAMNLSIPEARYDGEFGPGVVSPSLDVPPEVEATEWRELIAGADLHLQWIDSSGARITLSGMGLSEEELRTIARSLSAVDADTWFALQGRGAGEQPDTQRPGTTATTGAPAAPEADSAPTAPADVPAGGTQVRGTYDGTEHYVLTERTSCAIEHTLDATFTLADGATWQHHADYCGDLDDDMWVSPGGTFTFTLPDGATLTGTMPAQEVSADSDGEPYQLTITGGTGSHAGASGTCDLDNQLTDIALGTQQQTGSFTCTFIP